MNCDIVSAMVESLREYLTTPGNEFNPCGAVHVALFFESFIVSNDGFREDKDTFELDNLAKETLDLLNKKIDYCSIAIWDNEENKQMHLTAYQRMKKSLETFLE